MTYTHTLFKVLVISALLAVVSCQESPSPPDPCDDLTFHKRASSLLVQSQSSSQLDIKYLYVRVAAAAKHKLCAVLATEEETATAAATSGASRTTASAVLECSGVLKTSLVDGDHHWKAQFNPITHPVVTTVMQTWTLQLETDLPLTYLEVTSGLAQSCSCFTSHLTRGDLRISSVMLMLHLSPT